MSGPLLQVEGLSKAFPGVRALVDFEVDVQPGEVHALVGQNGAGKSTFIKILAGAYQPDSGSIRIDGQKVAIANAADSAALGIAVIHQDLNLVPIFDVADAMTLGLKQPTRLWLFRDRGAVRRQVARVLRRLETDFDADTPVASLSVPQQQMVAVGRALLLDARVVVMDEPTASLGAHEVEQVFRVVRTMRDQGKGVIYVSHRLDEVAQLADRITVMRDGHLVGTFAAGEVTSRDHLVQLIVGRPEHDLVRAGRHTVGEVGVSVRGLSWRGRVNDVSFDLHRGEVTGLAGLGGSGRSELASLLFGAARPDSGEVIIDGSRVTRFTPARSIRAGVALLPEDRRGQAAFVSMTLRENITISALRKFSTASWMHRRRERAVYRAAAADLGIVARGPETPLSHLSGGNQQKVVIAKWLQTDASLLIFDEPTQGVDVGAQEEIHRLIRELAHSGRSVLFISSDLEETLRVSDRTLVLREGRLVGDLRDDDATIGHVLRLCFGGTEVPAG